MKKLLILLSVVVLISCDKKDEDPKPLSKLVGTWTGVSTQTTMTVGDMSYEEYLISQGIPEDLAAQTAETMEQLLTLTGFYAEMEIRADGTWTGNSEFVSTPVVGKWELSSDEKTLTVSNDADASHKEVGTVTKLDDTDLWLTYKVDKSTLPQGTPTDFDYTSLMKFTRKK